MPPITRDPALPSKIPPEALGPPGEARKEARAGAPIKAGENARTTAAKALATTPRDEVSNQPPPVVPSAEARAPVVAGRGTLSEQLGAFVSSKLVRDPPSLAEVKPAALRAALSELLARGISPEEI